MEWLETTTVPIQQVWFVRDVEPSVAHQTCPKRRFQCPKKSIYCDHPLRSIRNYEFPGFLGGWFFEGHMFFSKKKSTTLMPLGSRLVTVVYHNGAKKMRACESVSIFGYSGPPCICSLFVSMQWPKKQGNKRCSSPKGCALLGYKEVFVRFAT